MIVSYSTFLHLCIKKLISIKSVAFTEKNWSVIEFFKAFFTLYFARFFQCCESIHEIFIISFRNFVRMSCIPQDKSMKCSTLILLAWQNAYFDETHYTKVMTLFVARYIIVKKRQTLSLCHTTNHLKYVQESVPKRKSIFCL